MTEACAQRSNESLANAATVLINRKGLDAFKLVIEQLSQFYKNSAKVIVEMIQYALDSTYKAIQEEWTEIEGMIQSEFERIIQETHAVEKAAQETFIFVLGVRQHRDLRLQPMGQSDDQYAERCDTELDG